MSAIAKSEDGAKLEVQIKAVDMVRTLLLVENLTGF
jgi:hypothetical protein